MVTLNISLRFSGWEPPRTSSDYADGCRRLRDRINSIEVSAASHTNIYCKVMGASQEFPKNPSTSSYEASVECVQP
ncbi:hypothetical protein AYI69_g9166 [Smittium culicis]|uniref:Uncharacterized protein n=1 Tax=Smittium culicis TaxID=133412 RepID=A0A1R1XEF7_9FUNG|nr:hypothetical protein AYI69_g9166 [Smittium culicis]